MSNETPRFTCSQCHAVWQREGQTHCWSSEADKPDQPKNCPAAFGPEVIGEAFRLYTSDTEEARIAAAAAKVEGLCYETIPGSLAVKARWTRVEDTMAFAKLMGYQKIGIATCIGMLSETHALSKILTAQGFEALSVCCKSGSIDKLKLGIDESYKVRPGTFEPACNPIAQARFLNLSKTDMNLIVGLCVGHDMLFSKHSDAPVSTIVVKDRVTGHNPVSVLYGQNFYYKRLQSQKLVIPEKASREQASDE